MAEDTIQVEREVTVQIETYEIEDSEWPGDEIDKSQYRELAEKIGATEQVALADDEGTIPFERMSSAVEHVWTAFCPGRHKLERFRDGLIPMRVMRLLERCIERGYFDWIEIWTKSESSPDPIAVGCLKDPKYSSLTRARYLIARWGESLLPWPEVVKKAREKWMRERVNETNQKIAEQRARLDSIEADADQHFRGSFVI